ncbi:MAG TPA: DnaJ family domain-containing protein [Dehalococcoidia bacterium]|nr:DnaJ family domain-containing protein [Dehalococcoidia bacterium]
MADLFNSYIENKLREAEEKGTFRNLPGQGQPLRLDDDDRSDPKYWLAHHMLKNAGLLPAWIELAKEIDALEDGIQAIEREYAGWLAAEADRLAGVPAAALQTRLPGIRAIYIRFLQRYQNLLRETQAQKQRFNYEVPARSLEKTWPPLNYRLRDFQERARRLLTGPEIAPLPAAVVERAIEYPFETTDALRQPIGPFGGAGQTLMASAARSILRENILRKISDAAAVVMIKRPAAEGDAG